RAATSPVSCSRDCRACLRLLLRWSAATRLRQPPMDHLTPKSIVVGSGFTAGDARLRRWHKPVVRTGAAGGMRLAPAHFQDFPEDGGVRLTRRAIRPRR